MLMKLLPLQLLLISVSMFVGASANAKSMGDVPEHQFKVNARASLSGKVVYFPMTLEAVKDPAIREALKKLKKQIEGDLTSHGFTMTDKRVAANLWIELGLGKYPEQDGDPKFYTLQFEGNSQSYGERMVGLFTAYTFWPMEKGLDAPEVTTDVSDWMKHLYELPVHIPNPAPPGLPGCTPRFGFEYDEKKAESHHWLFIGKVAHPSAAEDAGIQVGDLVESVDGIAANSPKYQARLDFAYKQLSAVTMKIKRNGKDMGFKITPAISCVE
jgi:hypothetical protein